MRKLSSPSHSSSWLAPAPRSGERSRKGHDVQDRNEPNIQKARPAVPISIGVAVLALLGVGGLMVVRAESKTNQVAMGSSAKPVTVARAKGTTFRASRKYVGTLQPWVEA